MDVIRVDVPAADLAAGQGVIVVARDPTRGPLAVGQQVVVVDADGEFHGGVVLAAVDDPDGPGYRLLIGARLPAEVAAERIADQDVLPEHARLHEVVDLLGDLRRAMRGASGES